MRKSISVALAVLAALGAFAKTGEKKGMSAKKGPPPASARPLSQNEAEFALADSVPAAADAVKIPVEAKFGVASFVADETLRRLHGAIDPKKSKDLKTLLKDRDFVRAALALDAVETAGAENLEELAGKDPKYGNFLKEFLRDVEFMRLYAGAGLVPTNAVGIRVMADIWATDFKSPDFDKRLAAGIGATWGAGPQSAKLQYHETMPKGNGLRCDPVWRYWFYKESAKSGLLHPNFANLRPWEIRFVVGNSWDDESLFWLQKRINLPWDAYGQACWAAKYLDTSMFGMTVQGPLYAVQAPAWMGDAEATVIHGGVCGSLSHTGAHAAAAHGIPAYTVGQPGHCAYGFRLERGKWQGGFGGPDGGPHNWIFPGTAPTMTRLMEAAFRDDRAVDRCVVVRAFARAGVDEAAFRLAQAWPHNWYVQREYLDSIAAKPKALAKHAKFLLPYYREHGFAFAYLMRPYNAKLMSALAPEQQAKWLLAIHRAIANTPSTWAEKKLAELLDEHVAAVGSDGEADFVAKLFGAYMAGANSAAFGQLLEWSIAKYVATGKDEIFAEAFKNALENAGDDDAAPKKKKRAATPDKNELRKMFANAIVAAEKARSALAVNALTDLAEKQGLANGSDPGRKIPIPEGETLVSDKGLLSLSTTCSYDHPIDHRNVLRDAAGQFHTDKETTNWAIVELPEAVDVSTVLIVKNSGNEHRSKHMKISRSVDGATYFPVAESEDTPKEWRVDAEGKKAKWIKVERISDGEDFFHLRNILVFTKGAGDEN